MPDADRSDELTWWRYLATAERNLNEYPSFVLDAVVAVNRLAGRADFDPAGLSPADIARGVLGAVEQGLPAQIEDPAACHRIATLIRSTDAPRYRPRQFPRVGR